MPTLVVIVSNWGIEVKIYTNQKPYVPSTRQETRRSFMRRTNRAEPSPFQLEFLIGLNWAQCNLHRKSIFCSPLKIQHEIYPGCQVSQTLNLSETPTLSSKTVNVGTVFQFVITWWWWWCWLLCPRSQLQLHRQQLLQLRHQNLHVRAQLLRGEEPLSLVQLLQRLLLYSVCMIPFLLYFPPMPCNCNNKKRDLIKKKIDLFVSFRYTHTSQEL